MHRRECEGVDAQLHQLRLVVGKAAARAAEGERGAQHHGVADPLGRGAGLLQTVGDLGGDDRLADGLAQLLELLTVLGLLDALAACAEQLNAALAQHALALELHGEVQTRLPADAGNDGVGALVADDLRDVLERQRLHVDLVGDGGVGHDGRGVGVDEDDLVALLLQRQTRLCAGVVKLRRLTDHDGAGADDENFLDVCPFHTRSSPCLRCEKIPARQMKQFICRTGKQSRFNNGGRGTRPAAAAEKTLVHPDAGIDQISDQHGAFSLPPGAASVRAKRPQRPSAA